MSRQRMTWTDGVSRHASEHPSTPDEGAASPAHKPEPAADAYANGDPSSWAEDPHSGPYPNSAHPATPDEGAASPAHKAAALERKAAKCIHLATAMLGGDASVSAIEDQALTLMDLPDRSIRASIARIAEDADEAIDDDDAAEAEADLAEEPKKKASAIDRIARLERVLLKLAGSEDPEGDDDDDAEGSEDPGEEEGKKKASDHKDDEEEMDDEEEAKKKAASDDDEEEMEDEESKMDKKASPLERRMARIERVLLRLAGDEGKGGPEDEAAETIQEEKEHAAEDADAKKASDDDGESEGDESKTHLDYEEDKKASGHMDEEAMLEEMMLEEMMLEEGMDQNDPVHFEESASEDPGDFDEPMDGEIDEILMADPMGMDEQDIMGDDEMMVLASLFGKDAAEDKEEKEDHDKGAVEDDEDHIADLEEDKDEDEKDLKEEESKKKASPRPQPKRASKGAKTLGGVSKAASSEVGDLSKLWESAPDVSKFF